MFDQHRLNSAVMIQEITSSDRNFQNQLSCLSSSSSSIQDSCCFRDDKSDEIHQSERKCLNQMLSESNQNKNNLSNSVIYGELVILG